MQVYNTATKHISRRALRPMKIRLQGDKVMKGRLVTPAHVGQPRLSSFGIKF